MPFHSRRRGGEEEKKPIPHSRRERRRRRLVRKTRLRCRFSLLLPPSTVGRLYCVYHRHQEPPPGSEMGKREKPREWRRRRGAATKAPCFKRNGREDAGKPCAMMSLPKDRGIQYFLAVRLRATLKPHIRKPSPDDT